MRMRLFPMLMMLGLLCVPGMTSAQRVQQKLGRGVVVAKNGTAATLTWRRLAQEPEDATYNIYVNGTKLNSAPLKNTNFATTAAKVPVGSEVEVKVVYDGKERSVGVPHKVGNYDLRNMFMSIRFDKSPLTAANYSTDYVWPADLDGDGEMDYVVNRKSVSTGLDNYVEAYLSSGEHLWTVKLGPNELSCAGQDDMILAYDMDCDGKADVVMQTSDGTQFWDADNKTYGLFVNGNTTGDTDGDGIIDYEKQGTKNAPRYMTVVDGMTGKEKASVEQTYNSSYNRTNKSALMGDEYNKHVGHVGVFYNDGVHPAVIMEWHTRNSNGSHNYHNSAFAYDFSGGKAGEWKELFCKNTGGPAFHHIRIADVDGDGKDEMLTGGYTMDDNGSTLNNPGISHGDRFRTSDIDPERPGLETFAIQQNAGDMLGQILYDAATGKAIKKWYLSAVGDVGRGECMDVDPNHLGWEMWSTMGGVYNAKGDLIPEHSAPYPTEGIWWDNQLDREIVQTSDSHHNVYIQDFYKGRLIEIAKLSGWRYVTVYAKRAAFWGDIIGDWREELVLLNKENGVCVGIVGFTTDYTTDIDNIYCLQEDPAYRMQCTTKGYYQSPNTGFYLGYDMPRPTLPPVMVADFVYGKYATHWSAGGFTNYDRSESATYEDGKSVLFGINSSASCQLNEVVRPSVLYAMPVKGQEIVLNGGGSIEGPGQLWKSQQGLFNIGVPLNHTGGTYISEGILQTGVIKGDVELRARGTLSGNAVVEGNLIIEGALNHEGCRLMPGIGDNQLGTIKLRKGLNINRRLFVESDIFVSDGMADCVVVEGDIKVTDVGELVFTIVPDAEKITEGRYVLMTYTGSADLDMEKVSVRGLAGLSYKIVNEDNAIWLVINAQREASLSVKWTGEVDGVWNYQTKNFMLNDVATEFVAEDAIEFNDDATTTTITVGDLMPVSKVTIDNDTKAYIFNGDGGFSGSGMFVKNGNGKLTLNTTKSNYTGATVINGGTVVVKELADGGMASSLGAASSSADNLKIGQATLYVNNSNTSTNRGITLTDTATIQVASGATSLKGIIKGSGMLVKTGTGQLNITYAGANTWSGGTQLKAGTLAMGAWNTTFGTATSKIEVLGNSTIRVFDQNSTSAVPTINNTIDVMKGKTLTIETGMRCAIRGKLTGAGNVKISFPYVRGDVYTNMSAFEGVFESTGGQLRLASAIDLSKGTLKLDAGVYAAHVKGGSGDEQVLTSKIGSLVSTATDCTLASGNWNVGYLGNNDTYAGMFNSAATLNKYGEGDLTLTGSSQGKVNIHEGRVLVNNTSAETTTGAITINNGGTLAGVGKTATVTVKKGGVISAGKSDYVTGTMTITGNLSVNMGGVVYSRVRGTSSTRNDAFNVAGRVALVSPVFRLERVNGEYSEGDEIKLFTGDGQVTLSGEPQFEPAVPKTGYLWDYSTLTTDGTIRVIADPVGIEGIEADADKDHDIFDVSGRKLRNVTNKGVYIINGKKVVK